MSGRPLCPTTFEGFLLELALASPNALPVIHLIRLVSLSVLAKLTLESECGFERYPDYKSRELWSPPSSSGCRLAPTHD